MSPIGESRPRAQAGVIIWLSCGCQVYVRNTPARDSSTYPCKSNMNHGYSVAWLKWQDERGNTGQNQRWKRG